MPVLPPSPRPLRVVVADDMPAVRRAVVALLREGAGVAVVGEAADAAGALAAVARTRPDAVVLDLQMPCMPGGVPSTRHGLAVLRRLTSRGPVPRVVVLTHHATDPYRAACLTAGAHAVLDKGTDVESVGRVLLGLAPPSGAWPVTAPAGPAILGA